MQKQLIILAIVAISIAFSGVAAADDTTLHLEMDKAPGAETHDGFFLRMSAGLGGSNITAEPENGGDREISGAGGSFELSIGGALTENVILHGTLAGAGIGEPNFHGNGDAFQGEYDDVSLGFVGIGATYYIMPANVYISSSIGASSISLEGNDQDRDREMDDNGVGLILQVGKEWWVSDNWGIGVAAQTHLGGLQVDDAAAGEVEWGYFNYGLLFSATYN